MLKKLKYLCGLASAFIASQIMTIHAYAAETIVATPVYTINPNISVDTVISGLLSIALIVIFALGCLQSISGIIALVFALREPERGGVEKHIRKIILGLVIMSMQIILLKVGLLIMV